jgi:phage terminase large subunit
MGVLANPRHELICQFIVAGFHWKDAAINAGFSPGAAPVQAWVEGKRHCLHEGGTSSSKTWSILQALIIIASESTEPLLISIVSESLPHLKRGVMRDFFNILEESSDNNPYFNKTECIYTRPDWKGRIEFFGADDDAKVRGPRRGS